MKNITISLSDKDHAEFLAIAKEEKRKPSELAVLLFAEGLDVFFCEDMVSIEKTQDEYTDEENAQKAKNDELVKTEGWYQLSCKEREEKGFIHVSGYRSNHQYDKKTDSYSDQLIEPLANSIRETVLKEVA